MTSNDNQPYITVELFNSKMETLITQIQLGNERLRNEFNSKVDDVKSEIRNVKSELHNEIQAVDANVKVNSAKTEMLGHYMYWGFAVMTLILTFVAFFVPYFLMYRKDKKQEAKDNSHSLSEDKVREMIAQALHQLNTVGK